MHLGRCVLQAKTCFTECCGRYTERVAVGTYIFNHALVRRPLTTT